MKKFTEYEINFIKLNHHVKSFKDIAEHLNRDYKTVVLKAKSLGLPSYERGKSPFSRKKRKYDCDDEFFEIPNLINSYWAGFIAADGFITSKHNNFGIMLAEKDVGHLEELKSALKTEKPICVSKSNNFVTVGLNVSSQKISNDLLTNFNITHRKTFTLQFPENLSDECKDAFIVGYIDGDGCITHTEKSRLCIHIIGTFKFLSTMKERLDNVFDGNSCYITPRNNIFVLSITNRFARFFYMYFYQLNIPKMERKWTQEKYDYALNYREPREKIHPREYEKIRHTYYTEGIKQSEIANIYKVHQVNISNIILGKKDGKQEEYVKRRNTSKGRIENLRKLGAIDLEEQESQDLTEE